MTKNVTKRSIQFDDYRECLFSRKEQHRKMNVIRKYCHEIYTEEVNKIALSSEQHRKMNVIRKHCHEIYTEEDNKIALSSDDDKRVIMADGIHTLAYGHTNLKKL